MEEITLRSKSIYEGRVVKFSLLDVRLPDGNEAQRELITHPGAVAIVALDAAQNMLFVRQYRSAARKSWSRFRRGRSTPAKTRSTAPTANCKKKPASPRALRGTERDLHRAGLHDRIHPPVLRDRTERVGAGARRRRIHRGRAGVAGGSAGDDRERRDRRRQEYRRAAASRAEVGCVSDGSRGKSREIAFNAQKAQMKPA